MSSNRNSWVYDNWRPWSAVVYLVINIFDFILFPALSWWWANYSNTPYLPWNPLTLQGAGFFHISFGALLTATSWSKTKEKINNAVNSSDQA